MIIAEAISLESIKNDNGDTLHSARKLDESSAKYICINKILSASPVSYFVELNDMLNKYLGLDNPFVFVTDWSDPRELIGLRLETDEGIYDYPDLCFIAFSTEWEDIESSGIENIFAHEISHMWLSMMGYDFKLSKSNRFHTCTAVTDRYMAFQEGFAEHFEIVTHEMMNKDENRIYDHGFDIDAWLCIRDKQMRLNAVKNNRFLYQTAVPYYEDFDTYKNLHMAHITSSAFMPERLKNGLQAVSSEGLIASFFYRMYCSEIMKDMKASEGIYKEFGLTEAPADSLTNLYVKILYSLSKTDLTKEMLFTDFIAKYIECFPDEKAEVLGIFAFVTNFVTVDCNASYVFGNLYRVGRRGVPDDVTIAYSQAKMMKSKCMKLLMSNEIALDRAVYKSIWVEADKRICPVPWEPDHSEFLMIDINAASAVDFYSFDGISYEHCKILVEKRERRGGFKCSDEFWREIQNFRHGL